VAVVDGKLGRDCLHAYYLRAGREGWDEHTFPFDEFHAATGGRYPFAERRVWYVNAATPQSAAHSAILHRENRALPPIALSAPGWRLELFRGLGPSTGAPQ